MADPRFLLATAIDDSAEALYRIVADIPDPVAKARAALSAVDQIQGHLLPDLVSIRRAAIREARQRMSAQELADRLGMSRSRVYAVLASADNATGPLTIHYRTADGGVGEAPVAWTVEPLRGTRRIRVTPGGNPIPADRTGCDGGGTGGFGRRGAHPHRFPVGRRLPQPGEPGRVRAEPG